MTILTLQDLLQTARELSEDGSLAPDPSELVRSWAQMLGVLAGVGALREPTTAPFLELRSLDAGAHEAVCRVVPVWWHTALGRGRAPSARELRSALTAASNGTLPPRPVALREVLEVEVNFEGEVEGGKARIALGRRRDLATIWEGLIVFREEVARVCADALHATPHFRHDIEDPASGERAYLFVPDVTSAAGASAELPLLYALANRRGQVRVSDVLVGALYARCDHVVARPRLRRDRPSNSGDLA